MSVDTDSPDVVGGSADHDVDASAWRQALRRGAFAYLVSRICVMAGASVIAAELRADENRLLENHFVRQAGRAADPHVTTATLPGNALKLITDVLTGWDGQWYLRIVRFGYPRHVPSGVTYDDIEARAAFFPLYPAAVRAVDRVLPGGDVFAALALNFVLGALFVALVGVLARQLFGVHVAQKAMILTAVFPGAFVLSYAYTEALLLVLAAGCFLALQRRMWLLAGVLAALGAATRPNGVALVAACAVAAYFAIRERREWMSLVSVVLAPVGFLAFQLWVGWHAGETGIWFRVQSEAWDEGISFGTTAIGRSVDALIHPLSSPTDTITAVASATTAIMVWFLWRKRLPAPMVAYTAVVLALMLLPDTVTARPRFLYTAFPLLISTAAWLDDRDDEWMSWVLALSCSGLAILTGLYGGFGAIP